MNGLRVEGLQAPLAFACTPVGSSDRGVRRIHLAAARSAFFFFFFFRLTPVTRQVLSAAWRS